MKIGWAVAEWHQSLSQAREAKELPEKAEFRGFVLHCGLTGTGEGFSFQSRAFLTSRSGFKAVWRARGWIQSVALSTISPPAAPEIHTSSLPAGQKIPAPSPCAPTAKAECINLGCQSSTWLQLTPRRSLLTTTESEALTHRHYSPLVLPWQHQGDFKQVCKRKA